MKPVEKDNIGSNTVAVVQARMGASRLPNKMMMDINGYPIIEWVFRRLKRCKKIDEIIFTIPDSKQDDLLSKYLHGLGGTVFRGSELNVLERFYQAATYANASHVVRICADNPLICPVEVDQLVHFFFQHGECDYAYNHIPINNQYPDGLGAEMISFDLLSYIFKHANTLSQKEHAFNYIWDNSQHYSIATFDPQNTELWHPELRLNVDTIDDYQRLVASGVKIQMNGVECLKQFL